MKFIFILLFTISFHLVSSQADIEHWMTDQLGTIAWKKTYEGVLADYHPVTIVLASDKKEIAGYIMHRGDQQKHRLFGQWDNAGLCQLQERDDNDRLTGYITGIIKDDHLSLKWISVSQDKVFDIQAATEGLIKVSSSKPITEWIHLSSEPKMSISVQKPGNGIVVGFANIEGSYVRFDGICLDGSCSFWKTSFKDTQGKEYNLQMRLKTAATYKASLNDVAYSASILHTSPLEIRHIDKTAGFVDFSFPVLQCKAYQEWIETCWNKETGKLDGNEDWHWSDRLVLRSSGWIEIVDETDDYITGLFTNVSNESSRREAFLVFKKDEEMIPLDGLLNSSEDIIKGSASAFSSIDDIRDEQFYSWIEDAGYSILLPTEQGVVMATKFNAVFGDDLRLLSIPESKKLIKRKYWRYFGW